MVGLACLALAVVAAEWPVSAAPEGARALSCGTALEWSRDVERLSGADYSGGFRLVLLPEDVSQALEACRDARSWQQVLTGVVGMAAVGCFFVLFARRPRFQVER